MADHPDLGWTDPVGRLVKLQTAVRILAEGRGKTANRLEKATDALMLMQPEDFPAHIRNRASKVLSLRRNAAISGPSDETRYFDFHRLKPSERARFVGDLIALYKACLIDVGRTWPKWDFLYPEDIELSRGTGGA